MKPQQGSVLLIIIAVLVLAGVGGAFYYQKNIANTNTPESEITTPVVDQPQVVPTQQSIGATPQELFLERNNAMNSAQSLEELMIVARKYDTQDQIAKVEKLMTGTTQEQRDQFFIFAKGLLVPNNELTNIQESITGDTAIVKADASTASRLETEFIKEGGVWKISNSKTINR